VPEMQTVAIAVRAVPVDDGSAVTDIPAPLDARRLRDQPPHRASRPVPAGGRFPASG